ncbi:hypothetical protein NQ095_00215 [Rossellomorea sp. SC111]|uniref:hypothetical protein n=1 Tax=Rossellomorea sp. SC111 TaxID=2968985 RepID=UPI00215B4B4A|nr:hypothetical protein [Rossellomorea sp. SC111]MCR8846812.1 hypothetical protein [Rossellomorea sp. SC111]
MPLLTLLLVGLLSYMMYYRYFPVRIKRWNSLDVTAEQVVVDVRDYQDSSKGDCEEVVALPCGYIRRYASDIPEGPVIVMGSSLVECNVGVRQLKRLGFDVKGYLLIESEKKCNEYLYLG